MKSIKLSLVAALAITTSSLTGAENAPVDPLVLPVPEVSGWDFNGEAAIYSQTMDQSVNAGIVNLPTTRDPKLFSQASSAANVGLRLGGVNNDLFAGIGAGFELVGLGTLGLQENVVSGVMQTGAGALNSGAITQGYLTYGAGNTSVKVGRQTIPKGLSPFAFSETWNVFQNTFESALVVNSDIPDTALVYAFVSRANGHANLSEFNDLNGNGNGIHMLTAQNNSIEGLTLTGSYYIAPDMLVTENVNILWADAEFAISEYSIGLQGGTVMTGQPTGVTDTTSFGAKIGGDFGIFHVGAAYTTVNDGSVGIRNIATPTLFGETALYTGMVANVDHVSNNNNSFLVRASVDVLGGNLGVAYGHTTDNAMANSNYQEIDVVYTTNITKDTSVLVAYIRADDEALTSVADVNANNIIRVWGRYNF